MDKNNYFYLTIVNWIPLLLMVVSCGETPQIKNYPPQNNEICCFGDSLVYGVGADSPADAYPDVLAKLTGRSVYNWGTSGDTTSDGLNKCIKFQERKFGAVIVTLGGNDILRRIRWEITKENLRKIFQLIQESGAVVVFTGVTGPLNPTREKLYGVICKEQGVLYIPEILKGIMNNTDLKSDEIHPNSEGYKLMAERVSRFMENNQL